MIRNVGEAVFAVRNANDTQVFIYGHGVYAGDFVRPGFDVEGILEMCIDVVRNADANPVDVDAAYAALVDNGEMTRQEADDALARARESLAAERARPVEDRARELAERTGMNPRIDLDGGGTVWGFQCWWGPASRFDEFVAGREVVVVDPPD